MFNPATVYDIIGEIYSVLICLTYLVTILLYMKVSLGFSVLFLRGGTVNLLFCDCSLRIFDLGNCIFSSYYCTAEVGFLLIACMGLDRVTWHLLPPTGARLAMFLWTFSG